MKLEELRGKDTFEARAVLEGLTVKELKEICKEHHRRGYSRYKKYQLVNELMMACCDEFLLSDLNGAKRESADTPTENQSKTKEESTMTKMTTKQAIEAIRELTTADEIAAVLMNCTKTGIGEAFTAVTGEKSYPKSWTKETLADSSARRIVELKEAAKFLELEVMEKVGYLSVGTDLSLLAPVNKCSLYELLVIAQELGVRYDEYETKIKKICAQAGLQVSEASGMFSYYLSTQLSQLIKANVEYRWLHDGKIPSASAGTSESDSTEEKNSATTKEDATMMKQTHEDAVNEAMETVAVMTSAGDNNDNTRYVAMTKALKKYPLSVLKEVAARNNFNFKAYRLNKEEYAQELSNEIIRLLDFIDDGGREYQVTPLGAMRRDFLDGKITYVESDVRDKSVIDFLHSVLSNRPDSQTLLDLFSCEFLYKWITCTPEPHAFRHLDEAQLRIMTGFRCKYNDIGINSGMSIKIDLNTVEVRDTKLAGKCFAEFLQRKFAGLYEPETAIQEAAMPTPEQNTPDKAERELKLRVMKEHRELVRNGKYHTAYLLLYLLREGKVSLGLGDASHEAESILEKLGCQIGYSHSYSIAKVYLRPSESYVAEPAPEETETQTPEIEPLTKEQIAFGVSTARTSAQAACLLMECESLAAMKEVYREATGVDWEDDMKLRTKREYADLMGANAVATILSMTPQESVKATSVIDICAGVENYECGKLTKTELGEILSQASSETLRQYILEVIAPESGYELKRTA